MRRLGRLEARTIRGALTLGYAKTTLTMALQHGREQLCFIPPGPKAATTDGARNGQDNTFVPDTTRQDNNFHRKSLRLSY